jgi:ribosomal protein S12 methylthiotransferase
MLRIFKEQNQEQSSNQQKQSTAQLDPQEQKGKIEFDYDGNKISFISLGCPRNLVDSEVMLGILLKAGYEVAPNIEEADYLIINTCGFLEASRQESRDTVADTLATRKPGAKLIVTGCMVQTHHDEMQKQFPGVDYFLGSGDVEGILTAVQSSQKGKMVTTARSYLEVGEVPRQISTPKHFAYLKIAEGCRKRCAFCVIPTIKGPLKSKSKEQILKEFHLLLDQGVQEIILIAQDLGDYGKDKGFKRSAGLLDLLNTMLDTPKEFWLRLLYLYPDEISDDLIQLIKKEPRICPYLDMPIQHISDEMLRAMHRTTSKAEILDTITKLRQEVPGVVIRTSLMVGFPGETQEQFEELINFVQNTPLDNIGIFKYSREPGSYSYDLPDQIPEEVKEERYHRLMKIQNKVVNKRNAALIGKTFSVIVEGYHPESKMLMRGRYYGQCPEIDGIVIINDGRKVKAFGQRYQVKITAVADYDLIGSVVG